MNSPLAFVGGILGWILSIYILVLWARLILDFVPVFVRGWRPRGFLLVVAEIVFTLTDPPIRFFRRIIPPLRLGPVALDFGWLATYLSVQILQIVIGLVFR